MVSVPANTRVAYKPGHNDRHWSVSQPIPELHTKLASTTPLVSVLANTKVAYKTSHNDRHWSVSQPIPELLTKLATVTVIGQCPSQYQSCLQNWLQRQLLVSVPANTRVAYKTGHNDSYWSVSQPIPELLTTLTTMTVLGQCPSQYQSCLQNWPQ